MSLSFFVYLYNDFDSFFSKDASTRLYKKIADFKGTANELSTRVFDRIKVSKASSLHIFSFFFNFSLLKGSNRTKRTQLFASSYDYILRLLLM